MLYSIQILFVRSRKKNYIFALSFKFLYKQTPDDDRLDRNM
jgi:hypothetical protein